MDGLDGSTLFSRRLFKRKIKIHPQQKSIDGYAENIENNTIISNTYPTSFLSLKSQQKSKYLSYEDVVFPTPSKQLHRENIHVQENDNKDLLSCGGLPNKNLLSCSLPNNSTILRSEDNFLQHHQRDVSERIDFDELTSLNVAQKDQKGNWFQEIKKMCFNLVGKINVFKMMSKNGITKDHWKEDSTTKHCSFCHRKFTMFFRRHHCRICGNIYCSSCSSGRTLLDPNIAMPIQFVDAATSNKSIKYNRNSGGFEFDGFEYNYLDYEEDDQDQREQQQKESDREYERYWEYHQQKQSDRDHDRYWEQKHEFDCELGQDYDRECLYRHDYEYEHYQTEPEFDNEFDDDENYTDDYFDGYSVTDSSNYSSSSSSLVDFTYDLVYGGSSTMNNNGIEERNKDGINYGSEPVRERICINCHKVFDLDESDWCCN